jgi:hypothetical protein
MVVHGCVGWTLIAIHLAGVLRDVVVVEDQGTHSKYGPFSTKELV